MALNNINIDFAFLTKEKSFRYDVDYIVFQSNSASDRNYKFSELFDIVTSEKITVDNLEDDFYYSEISNVSKNGDVAPIKLNFSQRNDDEENYYKKIEKGDIIKPIENSILISKVRPNLKKYVYVDEQIAKTFFTSAFINIIPKDNNKVIYYALRSVFFNNLIAISRQGKGYPTLKEDDLFTIKFDKKSIDKLTSTGNLLLAEIEKIEELISDLAVKIKSSQEVIDDVFASHFGFDIENADKKKKELVHYASLEDLANEELKFDISLKYRYIFLNYIKNPSNIEWIELGKLVDVKGGKRLPKGQNITEEETDYKYIRVDDLSWSGIFDLENIKYISEENHKAIKNYIAKENDILLTIVGATVGKCGLVPAELDGENITENFARLIIKDKENYLPEYVNYCLQSKTSVYQIDEYKGRGSQGKLALFRIKKIKMPKIRKTQQQEIVDEIKVELDKQELLKQQITTERNKIDKIIEECIMTAQ